MSLFINRFSFAMFSPFFPIALPMSPSFTTKISLSVASTQSTTVVRVRSWKRATYLIVCSSKTISAMRILDGEDVRLPGADHRDCRDRERHTTGGPKVDVRPGEPKQFDVPELVQRTFRAVRSNDDQPGALCLGRPPNLPQSKSHVPRVRSDAKRPRNVDHGTTSSSGGSVSTGSRGGGGVAGFGFGIGEGFGSPAGGL